MKEYFVKEYISPHDQPFFERANDFEQKQNEYTNKIVVSSWKDGYENIETRDLFNNFRIEKFNSITNPETQARMVGHFLNPDNKVTLEKIMNGNGTFAQNLSPAEKSKLLDIASESDDLERVKSLAIFVMDTLPAFKMEKIILESPGEKIGEEKEVDLKNLESFLEEFNSAIDQSDMTKFERLIKGNEKIMESSLTKAMENGYKIDQILIQLLSYSKYQEFSIQTLHRLYLEGNKEVVLALQKAQADSQKREPAKNALKLISPSPFGGDLVGNTDFLEPSPYDPEYSIRSQKTEPLPDDIPMLDTTQLEQLLQNPNIGFLTLNSLLQIGVPAMPALCVILTHKRVK